VRKLGVAIFYMGINKRVKRFLANWNVSVWNIFVQPKFWWAGSNGIILYCPCDKACY
jgi:hypothetical protein